MFVFTVLETVETYTILQPAAKLSLAKPAVKIITKKTFNKMNPFLTAAMGFILGSVKRNRIKAEPSQKDKEEIKKIESMGLFSAINYIQNKNK